MKLIFRMLIPIIIFTFFSFQTSIFAECPNDTQGPTAVCISFPVIEIGPSGETVILPEHINLGSSDDCTSAENLSFSFNPSSLNCSQVGTTVVVLMTVIDEAGNSNVCFSEVAVVDNQGFAIGCFADITIAVPPSGTYNLTTNDLEAFNTENCDLIYTISPSTLDCDDVGSVVSYTLNATDPGGNTNSCFGNITVIDDQIFAIGCFADVTIAIPPSGEYNLTINDLEAFNTDNCDLTYTISPSILNCDDVGSVVSYTVNATDPGGNTNSCFGNIQVLDPRPSSCEIIPPNIVLCGQTDLIFLLNITGGYGPFQIDWNIKGKANGWAITSGQGTDQITMDAGNKKITLEVTITDICGKKTKCKLKIDCDESAPRAINTSNEIDDDSRDSINQIYVHPNPTRYNLLIDLPNEQMSDEFNIYITNASGQLIMKNEIFDASKESYAINVSGLSKGLYFLIVFDQIGNRYAQRFVKI